MEKPIYLDYMATTPVDSEVILKMMNCLGVEACFGNPASQTHQFGWEAAELIHNARTQVAALLHSDSREIIWTSGATEATNLAIKGACSFYQRQGKHIITMKTEHKATLDTCAFLETQGFEVTYLAPDENGILTLSELEAAIRPDTILISIMYVNNETGVIQDIKALATLAKAKGIIFHTDAVQAAGKIELDLTQLPVDLLSMSGHKLYGPKGVGILYVRRNPRIRLIPQIHGGGHEQGLRSGTLPTHQIVGMGAACALAQSRIFEDNRHYQQLIQSFLKKISILDGVLLNGSEQQRISNCLNLSFEGVDNEMLLVSLPGIAVSSGSACNSAQHQASHVLLAMGISAKRAMQALRFSVGRFTTMDDIESAANQIINQVNHLRNLTSG